MSKVEIDHYTAAERELDRADYVMNADHYSGDRREAAKYFVAVAQVHATLAQAKAVAEAGL